MENAWKVIWQEHGKKLLKRFPGDPTPKTAVAFAKQLKARGLTVEGVVSQRKAYPPPAHMRERIGKGIWCPYCVKWRDFREFPVKLHGITLPSLLRCPCCHISIDDGFVRQYNQVIFIEYSLVTERKLIAARKQRG